MPKTTQNENTQATEAQETTEATESADTQTEQGNDAESSVDSSQNTQDTEQSATTEAQGAGDTQEPQTEATEQNTQETQDNAQGENQATDTENEAEAPAEPENTDQTQENAQNADTNAPENTKEPENQAQAPDTTDTSADLNELFTETLLEVSPPTLYLTKGEEASIAVKTNADSYEVAFDNELMAEIEKGVDSYRFSALKSGNAAITLKAQKDALEAVSKIVIVNIRENAAQTLLAQIDGILGQNNAWVEQIRFTLLASRELLNEFDYLLKTYNDLRGDIATSNALISYSKEEIANLNENFKANLNEILPRANALKAELESINAQVLANATATQNALTTCQSIKDNIDSQMIDMNAISARVNETYEALQKFNGISDEVIALITRAEAITREIDKMREDSLKELETALENAKNDISTHTNTSKDALNTHKDTLESEMTTHKELALKELEAFMDNVKQKIADLEQSFIEKTLLIQQTADLIKSENERLEANVDKIIAQAKEKLTEAKDEHLATMHTKLGEHLDNMKGAHDDYLQEIYNAMPAQIAGLSQVVNNIQESNALYGKDFVTQNFSASGTFNKVAGVEFYYVFVRGGTGGTNSKITGGVSSFGEKISANGGAGNPQGYGQKGEVKSEFVQLTDETTTITVASGGIVSVSYSQTQRKLSISFSFGESSTTKEALSVSYRTLWTFEPPEVTAPDGKILKGFSFTEQSTQNADNTEQTAQEVEMLVAGQTYLITEDKTIYAHFANTPAEPEATDTTDQTEQGTTDTENAGDTQENGENGAESAENGADSSDTNA